MGFEDDQFMVNPASRAVKAIILLFICLFCCAIYYIFLLASATVTIEIEVTEESTLQMYWASAGQPYSESRMAEVAVSPEKMSYRLHLGTINNIERLRLDTHKYPGKAILHRVQISQEGMADIVLENPEDFVQLLPLNQILKVSPVDNALQIVSSGKDPNFEFIPEIVFNGADPGLLTARFAAIVAVTLIFCFFASPQLTHWRYVALLLFGAATLILTMAAISKFNVHPDEYVHVQAVEYYQNHWLPPQIMAEEIADSYSIYGNSRLNTLESYYFFAGKYSALLEYLGLAPLFAKRLVNVTLFLLIIAYCLHSVHARMLALPLLLSAQLWYVFSYCNSDAFALFLSFLAGCQLIDPKSLLHRYLQGDNRRSLILGLCLLPLFLAAFFLIKKNFYPIIALFYAGLFLLLFSPSYYWERGDAIKRLLLLTLLAATLFGLRLGGDYAVNGLDRVMLLHEAKETYADYRHKPSTPLMEKNPLLQYRERGHGLTELIHRFHWGQQVFQSGFGVFDYFKILSPQKYYHLARWLATTLLIFLAVSILFKGGLAGNFIALCAAVLGIALTAAALYCSWVNDFQAQGRYLFPLASMGAMVYGWNYRAVNREILAFLVFLMYALAVYCFIFQAIFRIPKIVG